MKTDIVLIVILVLFGVLAGDIFLTSLEKTIARQQAPMMEDLEATLMIQRDLEAKLNYRTGDVAAQMAQMNDRLTALEKRLGEVENKFGNK